MIADFYHLAQTPLELRTRVTPLLATPWPWLGLVGLVGATVLPLRFLLRNRGSTHKAP